MIELALQFEYLMCRAFQCRKHEVAGANTGTFRTLEKTHVTFRDNKDPNKKDELLQKYAFDCGRVAAYINSALQKFIKDFDSQLTDQQNEELDNVSLLLQYSTIDKIEKAIEKFNNIMIQHEVQPQ